MAEFNAGQRTMLMDFFGDAGVHGNVVIAPDAKFNIRRHIGGLMNLGHFGADHGPAAFGLHAAHGGKGGGIAPAHAVAMGNLIEAVARRNGADFHGFKQDIVAGVSGHWVPFQQAFDF